MRKLDFAAAVILLAACGGDDGSGPDPATETVVSMPADSYTPFTTNIDVGGTVIFDFPARSHNVIFQRVTGAPTDIQETVNMRVSRTFAVAGTFPYDCTIHPGMSAVVIAK